MSNILTRRAALACGVAAIAATGSATAAVAASSHPDVADSPAGTARY